MTARYRLDGELGGGAAGPVHRAIPDRLGAPPVALRHLAVPAGRARARLRTRCETIAATGHPGLVVVEDVVDLDDHTVAVVTPIAAEGSLADRIAVGCLPVDEALDVVARVAEAMAAAHGAGLVHGRIHLGNVLLTESGPALTDLAQGGGTETRADVADVGRLGLGVVDPADRSTTATAYRAVCDWAIDDPGATADALARRLRDVAEPPSPAPASGLAPASGTRPGDRSALGLVAAVAVAVGAGVGVLATLIPPAVAGPEVATATTTGATPAPRSVAADAVHWSPATAELTLTTADGPARYRIGAPGDHLLVGDWDCDGSDTPAVFRPSTGETFLFDGWASDATLVAEPGEVLDHASSVEVRADTGCDRIVPAPS